MAEGATKVLVAGASGYAGALSAYLVDRHPGLELARISARSDEGKLHSDLYPGYGVEMPMEKLTAASLDGIDAAIVAYPHGASAPVVAALRAREIPVVDLSADFRLYDLQTYEKWYGEHPESHLLDDAVYGLPELHRSEIQDAGLVANPGCYPTASLLALAPLAKTGLIFDLVIDAKSGVSGAGRGKAEQMAVVKETDDAMAYGVAGHRHNPEIAQELHELGMGEALLTFIPHLMPFDQGELVSCYVNTEDEFDPAELRTLYEDFYADEQFVEIVDGPPGVGEVRDTNRCVLHVTVDQGSGRALVFGAIDNLWKGAASQAVQNLNLMLGLPEAQGVSGGGVS